MKTAIVTGANGFVGSALCRSLSSHGVKVCAVVRNKDSDISRISGLDNCEVHFCDMSGYGSMKDILKDVHADVFYHFAWNGSAGELRGDSDVQLKNVVDSCKAVHAAKELGCSRFVFAGSIMEFEIRRLTETHREIGINKLYCIAKQTADHFLRTIADDIGIGYVSGIISNIYGPGEKSPRIVNSTIRRLLKNEHCSFSAGEQMYDFIYSEDAAEAFYLLGKGDIRDKYYYIGSEKPRRLKEFLLEIRDIVSPGTELGIGEIPFDGVTLTYTEFDISALKRDTGFVPRFTFAEGISLTAEEIRKAEM